MAILITFSSHQPWAPFTIKNFIAVCITSELIQLVSLGRSTFFLSHLEIKSCCVFDTKIFTFLPSRFATSAVMLIGLLFYDVFWVFGSSHIFGDNVMVTVSQLSSILLFFLYSPQNYSLVFNELIITGSICVLFFLLSWLNRYIFFWILCTSLKDACFKIGLF